MFMIVGLQGAYAFKPPIEAVPLFVPENVTINNSSVKPERGFAFQNCFRLCERQKSIQRSDFRDSFSFCGDHAFGQGLRRVNINRDGRLLAENESTPGNLAKDCRGFSVIFEMIIYFSGNADESFALLFRDGRVLDGGTEKVPQVFAFNNDMQSRQFDGNGGSGAGIGGIGCDPRGFVGPPQIVELAERYRSESESDYRQGEGEEGYRIRSSSLPKGFAFFIFMSGLFSFLITTLLLVLWERIR